MQKRQSRFKQYGGDASAAWQVTGADPQGKPVVVGGISADLLRRQHDGRWLLVIDNPFGGE